MILRTSTHLLRFVVIIIAVVTLCGQPDTTNPADSGTRIRVTSIVDNNTKHPKYMGGMRTANPRTADPAPVHGHSR